MEKPINWVIEDPIRNHRLFCLQQAEKRAKNPEWKQLWRDKYNELKKSKI